MFLEVFLRLWPADGSVPTHPSRLEQIYVKYDIYVSYMFWSHMALVFKKWSDPDQAFKIWSDPNPVFKTRFFLEQKLYITKNQILMFIKEKGSYLLYFIN